MAPYGNRPCHASDKFARQSWTSHEDLSKVSDFNSTLRRCNCIRSDNSPRLQASRGRGAIYPVIASRMNGASYFVAVARFQLTGRKRAIGHHHRHRPRDEHSPASFASRDCLASLEQRPQLPPEVDVLPPLPAERHRLDHVLAVAANGHLDAGCYCAQRLDHPRYLHPVVRGRRVAAAELALTPVGLQDEHAPSARPWIADTGAVGIGDMRLARRHPLTHALPLRSN